MSNTVDLTADSPPPPTISGSRKRPLADSLPSARIINKPAKKVHKKETPHVLLWICAAGKGRGRNWIQRALRVIGAYSSKQAAEDKKEEVMSRYECCGHGDIIVGDSWEDEIDLVVRPIEEVNL